MVFLFFSVSDVGTAAWDGQTEPWAVCAAWPSSASSKCSDRPSVGSSPLDPSSRWWGNSLWQCHEATDPWPGAGNQAFF